MKITIKLIVFLLALYQTSFAVEIKLVGNIPLSQEDVILQNIVDLSVTEDEIFILLDSKAVDIKLYDNKGQLIRLWGRRGQGPGEFLQPYCCNYHAPYFVLYDFGKYKLSLYRRTDKTKFELISSIANKFIWDCELLNKNILLAGYIQNDGKKYDLYMRDLKSDRIDYILPSYLKYGYKSENEYDQKYRKIAPLGIANYIFGGEEYVYHVWHARIHITKINMRTKEMNVFGQETQNYKRPEVTIALKNAIGERNSKKRVEEKEKFSFVFGLFGDKNIIGLLYRNYDKETSGWKPVIQFYDPQGNFLCEKLLNEVAHYPEWGPPFFYNRETGTLYFISRQLNDDFTDRSEIVKYKIVR